MHVVADSSFVIAVASSRDKWHRSCLEVYLPQQEPIYLPQPTLSEIAHLVTRIDGNRAMIGFLKGLARTQYRVVPLQDEDIVRATELLEKYVDSRIDFVDAAIIALARRR
jgi:predicted nucleic acid-binding protein